MYSFVKGYIWGLRPGVPDSVPGNPFKMFVPLDTLTKSLLSVRVNTWISELAGVLYKLRSQKILLIL